MSYIVNKTDGSVLTTLVDGTTNTETGLTLIGRNYISYGEIQNENFVRLLENFASDVPPGESVGFAPIAGQLWWDTTNQRLRVYTGTEFANVSERSVGNTAPTTTKVGDQWWDTANKQLKVNDGTQWVLINPPYTAAQGKSGSIVETVTDGSSVSHTVVNTYTNGQLISVASYDPTFLQGTYEQFSYIVPGINLASNVIINGTADNANKLGGSFANTFPRTTVRTNFLSDLGVGGNLVLTGANISFSSNALVVQNTDLYGNIDMYVNTTFGNTRALRINGITGMVILSAHPTSSLGIATKGYTDDIQVALNTSIVSNVSAINANVDQLRGDVYDSLTTNVVVLTATINQVQADTNANIAALDISTNYDLLLINANLGTKTTEISSLQSIMPTKAAIDSPTFIGTPTAPTPSSNDNSTRIATTEYVDSSAAAITTYVNSQISATQSLADTNLSNGLASKAPVTNPTFTGTASAPTPSTSDNSTKIATTAFVRGAITGPDTRWQGSRYTVSASGPSGGDDGDFWFQIG